eukprot:3824025-Rhodomonas_salina.1
MHTAPSPAPHMPHSGGESEEKKGGKNAVHFYRVCELLSRLKLTRKSAEFGAKSGAFAAELGRIWARPGRFCRRRSLPLRPSAPTTRAPPGRGAAAEG